MDTCTLTSELSTSDTEIASDDGSEKKNQAKSYFVKNISLILIFPLHPHLICGTKTQGNFSDKFCLFFLSIYSASLSFSLQFFGVIVSWLYITRVEDAISEYGHYMDGLLQPDAQERSAKRQGRVSKWFKCMPEIDWWKQRAAKGLQPAHSWLQKPFNYRFTISSLQFRDMFLLLFFFFFLFWIAQQTDYLEFNVKVLIYCTVYKGMSEKWEVFSTFFFFFKLHCASDSLREKHRNHYNHFCFWFYDKK